MSMYRCMWMCMCVYVYVCMCMCVCVCVCVYALCVYVCMCIYYMIVTVYVNINMTFFHLTYSTRSLILHPKAKAPHDSNLLSGCASVERWESGIQMVVSWNGATQKRICFRWNILLKWSKMDDLRNPYDLGNIHIHIQIRQQK